MLDVKSTHRGPVIPFELLQLNSGLLFGGETPQLRNPGKYSFAWGGAFARDSTLEMFSYLTKAKDIPEFFEIMHGEFGNNYQGVGQNVILADTSGNIAYKLLMSIPERVDKTPFIGSRVLDGTTTNFDWTGRAIDLKDLPYGINPEKGFY